MVARHRPTVLGIPALLALCALCGCGKGPSTPTTSPESPSNLAGNWLLFGTLPKFVVGFEQAPGLSASFDVSQGKVTGYGELRLQCVSGQVTSSLGVGESLTGDLAADGSFNLASVHPALNNEAPTFFIQGKVPDSPGGTWSGTYTFTSDGLSLSGAPSCQTQTASFTATPVQDVSGTYTGAGSLSGTVLGAAGTSTSVILNLQQGGLLHSALNSPVQSRLALSGTIDVKGISCFNTGTISLKTPSEVLGNTFRAAFTMDDGSELVAYGSIADTEADALILENYRVTGGSCSGGYSFGLPGLPVHK